MGFRVRRRWGWVALMVTLAALSALLVSPESVYNRIQIGMTEDQVLDLLGRPSETYTFQMVKLLPDGSQLASVRYGKNWNRGYGTIRLLFENGHVVQKSQETLPERVREYAGTLLHGPRRVPPPMPFAPVAPTTSPPQGSAVPQ